MTFSEAMKLSEALSAQCDNASDVLNTFPRLENGLTPDNVRALPEWKAAKLAYDVAFKKMQDINSYIGKHYKKERSAYYQAKRELKLLGLSC